MGQQNDQPRRPQEGQQQNRQQQGEQQKQGQRSEQVPPREGQRKQAESTENETEKEED